MNTTTEESIDLLLGNYRRIVRTNLRIAFRTTLSKTQIRAYSREVFVNALQTFLEFALLYRLRQSHLARLTLEPHGYDAYKEALAQGRGVIAVSAHLWCAPPPRVSRSMSSSVRWTIPSWTG